MVVSDNEICPFCDNYDSCAADTYKYLDKVGRMREALERITQMVGQHSIIDAVHEAKRALGIIPERIDRGE